MIKNALFPKNAMLLFFKQERQVGKLKRLLSYQGKNNQH